MVQLCKSCLCTTCWVCLDKIYNRKPGKQKYVKADWQYFYLNDTYAVKVEPLKAKLPIWLVWLAAFAALFALAIVGVAG